MNNLTLIEPHAQRLEAAADRMDKDGIGGHASRGHVAVLRDMASCMRADAARGKVPNEYGGFLNAAAADADRPKRPLLTPLQCSQAKGGANRDLLRSVQARAARLGFRFEIDSKHIDVDAFNAAAKGKDIEERLAIKACWHKLGLIS